MRITRVALLIVLAATPPVWGLGVVNPTVNGTTVSAGIELAGGIGADLTLSFEGVVGLNLTTLGLSAQLVDPGDLGLLSRLPAGALVSVPAAFPVLVSVQPTAASTLSFEGVYTLGLHTHNLVFTSNTPLRLFAAHGGGAFRDITDSMGLGSYRVRGTGGSFSEFLIVADARTLDSVLIGKFNDAQKLLDDNAGAIAPAVLAALGSTLTSARNAYAAGAFVDATTDAESFATLVQQHSGADIPNVWRANVATVNVAGELRAAAATLVFSLNLKANQAP